MTGPTITNEEGRSSRTETGRVVQEADENQDEDEAATNKNPAKKCLEMLAKIAELDDDHNKFYELFVKCMKLRIRENSIDDSKIPELLKSKTSTSGDEQNNLKEYVDRMKGELNDI